MAVATKTCVGRWLLLGSLGLCLVAPDALAQRNRSEDRRTNAERFTIEIEDDSIRVTQDGAVTVVPNTPEGRAQLAEHHRALLDGDRVRFFRFDGEDADGEARSFAFRMPPMPDRPPMPPMPGEDIAFEHHVFRLPEMLGELGDGLRMRLERLETEDLEARMAAERELAELERATRDLARQAQRADSDERARLERDLDAKLGEVFDKKQAMRQARLEALQREVADLQAEVQSRQDARRDIIERRKRDLLGETDPLRW